MEKKSVVSTQRMSSSEFMQRLPEAVRAKLPPPLQGFQWRARSYLLQLYYDNPDIHFEAWSLRRLGRLEIGLHFESRDRASNERFFHLFDRHIIEIKARLGRKVELERWDRGWARIYESLPLAPFVEEFLETVATRLVQMISSTCERRAN